MLPRQARDKTQGKRMQKTRFPTYTEHIGDLSTPRKTDAPVLFLNAGESRQARDKHRTPPNVLTISVQTRSGKYYVLAGACCCICTGGSNILVMMADSIRGPWTYAGDVGSSPTRFDRHSPNNCQSAQPATCMVMIAK